MEKILVFLGIEIIKQAPHLVLDLVALWKTNTKPTAAEVMKIFGDVDKSYADLIKDVGGRPE